MANIRFIISKKVGESGKSEIYVRLPLSRTKYIQLHTGVFVTPSLFVVEGVSGNNQVGHIEIPKRGRLNNDAVKEAQCVQMELQAFSNRLQRICSVCDESLYHDRKSLMEAMQATRYMQVQDITQKSVCEVLRERERVQKVSTIYEYAELYLNSFLHNKRRSAHFRVAMRVVRRWEAFRVQVMGEDFSIGIDTLTSDDLNDLKAYIGNEPQLQQEHPKFFNRIMASYPSEIGTKHKSKGMIKPRGANCIIGIMKRVKTFWNWMIECKYTTNNPFAGVKIGAERYGTPYYLTIEERNALADYDLSARPQLAIQRDIFVFQCLVGCRVGDLYKLTESNITNEILEYVPHKTKDESQQVKPRIPLNERALRLVEAYRGKDSKGRLFPFISEQRYNDAIKESLRLCGIDRNVQVRNSITGESEAKPIYQVASSHMARRTFVGAAYAKVQDPNIIGKMSGHVEGSRAFVRYRHIDDAILKDVIVKIDEEEERNEADERKALLKKLASLSTEELKLILDKS